MCSESVLNKCDFYSQSFHDLEQQKASMLTQTYSHPKSCFGVVSAHWPQQVFRVKVTGQALTMLTPLLQ